MADSYQSQRHASGEEALIDPRRDAGEGQGGEFAGKPSGDAERSVSLYIKHLA